MFMKIAGAEVVLFEEGIGKETKGGRFLFELPQSARSRQHLMGVRQDCERGRENCDIWERV